MKHFSARRNIPPAQQGLTLIGQMMVLLVAGVLGAVALSSWLDLQVRERATEAYNQMEAIKPAANALGQEQRGEPWPASLSISSFSSSVTLHVMIGIMSSTGDFSCSIWR